MVLNVAVGDGLRTELDRRFTDAWQQKSSFEAVWRELGSYILPTRPRFFTSDANRGDRVGNARIMDGSATQSVEVARAGMMTGMASPSRPWHDLVIDGQGKATLAVKRWLDDARDAVLGTYDRSNFYATAASVFGDGLVFGTAPMIQLEDPKNVVRFQALAVGSYALAQNDRGKIDTVFREMALTLSQIASQFGQEALTPKMRMSWDAGRLQDQYEIRHAIFPNPDTIPGSPFPEHLPFREVYWESGLGEIGKGYKDAVWGGETGGGANGGILQVGGYHEFPVAVARWDRNDDDVYATSYPGIRALGDIKQLQQMVRTRSNAIEKMVNPSLVGGPGVKGRAVSLMSGAINIDPDMSGGNQRLQALHEVRFNVRDAGELEEQVRQRIRRFFYEDLFLMLLGDERLSPLTATETVARERERLAVLGPILERHSDDFFDPTVDRTLAIMMRLSEPDWANGEDGLLPVPPPELEGVRLRPRYTSEVADSQKAVGISPIERFANFVMTASQVNPDMLDIVDTDALGRTYHDFSGIPARLLRSPEEVEAIRAQRAQAQQQAAMMENASGMARAAKDLADTDADAAVDAAATITGG